jgi:hypothetical protein
MKHKHSEIIKAFADGKRCSWWDNVNQHWHPIHALQEFDWCETVQVDPEPKRDWHKFVDVRAQDNKICRWTSSNPAESNLLLIFDGETNKLKASEVIR